ncbi:transcription factor of the MADS box [Yamadazyma tenuis]|uniref:SRF-TF-domain-containing protein n=1 Tax=Candida tenuis (strain ATCC 10573 / BCRC 21748 / CBS 615 / JCM 9827 / NBRC 10315 / NRRL Y-1498 / VKM Y-70) TaxID=590646 RepID=G3AX13_CANTC|nr:SRF-TF-domain-containing protein [Yamadazyma tenuis ATCC 10573]EGV66662.1 SRF-TF-domain-containing protein [Yamadazyma tenuis ATCC 10573]WEJ95210.1 transcription factor of the MADS box [Yamadazyma tenuis]
MSEATEPKLQMPEGSPGNTLGTSSIDQLPFDGNDDDDKQTGGGKSQKERRKIEIKFIQDKTRRHITFSKRRAGIMKKAYELSVLTGTQVLLLVVSETGLVYTFTTPKLQPLVTKSEGKNLIQACLNAPEEGLGDDQDNQSEGNSPDSPEPAQQQHQPSAQPQQVPTHPLHHQQIQPGVAANQFPPGAHLTPGAHLPPAAHLPPGMPYPQSHPQMPMPPQGYNDPNVYQQYFNMQNGNIPNQQQYQ